MYFVGKCSSGWTEFRGCCYQASSYVMTWEKARDNCTANGANLVKIASAIENSFVLYLSNKFAPQRRQMWIGLRYSAADKKFHWSDGTLPQYSHWARGEPNGNAEEPCGNTWTKRYLAGTWNDLACGIHSRFPCGYVCEKIK